MDPNKKFSKLEESTIKESQGINRLWIRKKIRDKI